MKNPIHTLIAITFLINPLCASAQTSDSTEVGNYLNLATQSLNQDNYEKAHDYCLKALNHSPNCGEAYILMGYSFVLSVDLCGSNHFEKGMIYCLAVDMYEQAKTVDSTVVKKANKLIDIYSGYFPSLEDMFVDAIEGEKYKVGCWINRKTTVRFKKE